MPYDLTLHKNGQPVVTVPRVGVMRPVNPPPCTCEPSEAIVTEGDRVGLQVCPTCGGSKIVLTATGSSAPHRGSDGDPSE